jgi:hypothetical protein
MWKMGDLRKLAMSKLDTPSLSPVWRVVLGRKHGIADWVRRGYVALAQRREAWSAEDFKLLGIQSALDLSQRVRKPYRRAQFSTKVYKSELLPCANSRESSREAVSRLFEEELLEHSTPLSTVDRILLARKCGVSEWLHSEYVRLVERDQDLTLEEAEKLGPETLSRICRIRECIGNAPAPGAAPFIRVDYAVEPKVEEIFGRELADAQIAGELVYISQNFPTRTT